MALVADLLFARLTGDAALAALVGERVYPDSLPQDAVYPAIRYVQVSRVEVLRKPVAHPGGVGASLAIVRTRYQLDCYAKGYREAQQVQAAVIGAVYGWCDPAQGVIGARADDAQDVNDQEELMQRASVDASITHNE